MSVSKKKRVAVVFGGRSTEHEVSLSSAINILKNMDRDRYSIIPVKITRDGRWMLLPDVSELRDVDDLSTKSGPYLLIGDPKNRGFFEIRDDGKGTAKFYRFIPVDVVFPVLHGTFGEDGTVQGMLSLADIPFVGAGVLASSVSMDKIVMKQIFSKNQLPVPDFIWFLRKVWSSSPEIISERVEEEIGFPCFVKPANTGSSVGVSKVHKRDELKASVDNAAMYDRKIIVERAIKARELECSVLGNDDPQPSVVGEIIPANEFYDYEAKYISEHSRTVIPADIHESISKRVAELAVQAFKAVDCAGMGRVDFLLETDTDRIFVNEINTIPGFTQISMYPKLWEASGISYSQLIDRLIELAEERHSDLRRSKFRKDLLER